jgi:hypothetical protein
MTHMTPTLKTTSKATAAGKQRVQQTAPKIDDRLGQAKQSTPSAIKTVLVASYGWPTEAMLPSKRQAARR